MALLRDEFPQLEWVILSGPQVRYSSGPSQLWKLALQFPQMIRSISVETQLTDRICRDRKIDLIISDQRFGVRHPSIPSILITHQLHPRPVLFGDPLVRVNHHYIRKFDRCWVMDVPEAPGLAGDLSHGVKRSIDHRFIGIHSRFERKVKGGRKRDIVAILSGPEPQRSQLEKILLEQLRKIPGEHLLVQGSPGRTQEHRAENVVIVPHLQSDELARTMRSAQLVISRVGYSTLMDLVHLQVRALLIPTPGQPEQEYLATLPGLKEFAVVQRQQQIDVKAAFEQVKLLGPSSIHPRPELLDLTLDELAILVKDRRRALSST